MKFQVGTNYQVPIYDIPKRNRSYNSDSDKKISYYVQWLSDLLTKHFYSSSKDTISQLWASLMNNKYLITVTTIMTYAEFRAHENKYTTEWNM